YRLAHESSCILLVPGKIPIILGSVFRSPPNWLSQAVAVKRSRRRKVPNSSCASAKWVKLHRQRQILFVIFSTSATSHRPRPGAQLGNIPEPQFHRNAGARRE